MTNTISQNQMLDIKTMHTLLKYPLGDLKFLFYEIYQINLPQDILQSGYPEANTSQCISEFYMNLWTENRKISKEDLFFKCKECCNWAYFKFMDFKDTCSNCVPKIKFQREKVVQEELQW